MSEQSLTREELYSLVWSEPMLKVAERFNVSSCYMARFCTLLILDFSAGTTGLG